jgi:pimeloyl-ACP methyl ester carboxylesterase
VTSTVKYAKSGDVHIAYRVVGEGPIDLLVVPGWVSHLEVSWEEPLIAHFAERLVSFSRLIVFDKRGTGLSDPVPLDRLPTLEQRMEDVHAVLDAMGSTKAALIGISEGGPMCALFAATYPERTSALVMAGSYAKWTRDEDYPLGTDACRARSSDYRVRAQLGNSYRIGEHCSRDLQT